jgi:SAM-dependent methyltransferase
MNPSAWLRQIVERMLEDRLNLRRLEFYPRRPERGDESATPLWTVTPEGAWGLGVEGERYRWQEGDREEHLERRALLERLLERLAAGGALRCLSFLGDTWLEVEREQVRVRRGGEGEVAPAVLDPEEAAPLLQALGLLTPQGEWTPDGKRKFGQVRQFVERVAAWLEGYRPDHPLIVLDCGCGKSYLTFVLNHYLRERRRIPCYFYGVDTNAELVERVRQIQRRLDYRNMEFHVSTIDAFEPPQRPDLVCSLHACDTATDEALAKAIQCEAPLVLAVPCCQIQLRRQLNDTPLWPLLRFGVYKARLGDVLTDALRTLALEAAGYRVTVLEYISPLETPKNLMILATKHQRRNPQALRQYRHLRDFFRLRPALERLVPWLRE